MIPAFQHIFLKVFFLKKCKLLLFFTDKVKHFKMRYGNCEKLRYFYSPLRPVSLLFCQFRPRVLPVHSAEGGRGHEHALHLVLVENPEEKRIFKKIRKYNYFPVFLTHKF